MNVHDLHTTYLRRSVLEDLIALHKNLGELESGALHRYQAENYTEMARFYAHRVAEAVEELAIRGQLSAARVGESQLELELLERDVAEDLEKVSPSGESSDDGDYPF